MRGASIALCARISNRLKFYRAIIFGHNIFKSCERVIGVENVLYFLLTQFLINKYTFSKCAMALFSEDKTNVHYKFKLRCDDDRPKKNKHLFHNYFGYRKLLLW